MGTTYMISCFVNDRSLHFTIHPFHQLKREILKWICEMNTLIDGGKFHHQHTFMITVGSTPRVIKS